MPRDKDLKRLVRARMQKTGEAYTAARAQVLRKRTTRKGNESAAAPAPRLTPTRPLPAATATAPAPLDYAKLAGMKDDVIKEKTGRTWEEWAKTLDGHDAQAMAHRDIALLVSTKYKVADWWTQTVTVGYERIRGLRARGQRRDGTYEASKSRTINVPVKELFDACADADARRRWLTDVTGVKLRKATSPKSVRLGWPDGSIVVLLFDAKGASKSTVSVQHTKLPDKEMATQLKQFWGERLEALGKLLA